MAEMRSGTLQDEAVVLHVKNWQTADKYVVCFTKEHGKLRFIAYGARYPKNVQGRLLQPFARLQLEVQPGQRIDKLRGCELVALPQTLDMKQMAYAAVAAELTAVLTEDRAPQPELYEQLVALLNVLRQRNPRLVVLAFALKLLRLAGIAPQMEACVHCGRVVEAQEEAWFSALAGGVICKDCRASTGGEGLEHVGEGARRLWQWLEELDYEHPAAFSVRGGDMMEVEKLLFKFIFFQTDKPLNSLNFLSQLGL